MAYISLDKIQISGCRVEYYFSCDDSLAKYFTGKLFAIDYPENIESVPKGVLSVPFVVNVLPIVWLTDSKLVIDELDKDFYESIPEFKNGYIEMYPNIRWLGKIKVNKVVDCNTSADGGACSFFSGGLDATTTLLRHYHEEPDLLTIWGADIPYDNVSDWETIHGHLSETARIFNLPLSVFHSSFTEFDKNSVYTQDYGKLLEDSWWHGVKHGIAIIGHAAPYVWLHRKHTLYIGSSHCPQDGHVHCASNPIIDNYVRFCGCKVIHDGFELNRQAKVVFTVQRSKELNVPVQLHVCWETTTGNNCCKCEKCFRTMVGLWAAGANPRDYGFNYDENQVFNNIYELIALNCSYEISQWNNIPPVLKKNIDSLPKKVRNGLRWILKYDFDYPESNFCHKMYVFKRKTILSCRKVKHFFWRVANKIPGLIPAYRAFKGK